MVNCAIEAVGVGEQRFIHFYISNCRYFHPSGGCFGVLNHLTICTNAKIILATIKWDKMRITAGR